VIAALVVAALAGSQEAPAPTLRPLFEIPVKADRWFPLAVQGNPNGKPGGLEVRSAKGRVVWRLALATGGEATAAVFPGRGEPTVEVVRDSGSRESILLPFGEDSRIALVLGSGGEERLRERGYRVLQRDPGAVPLDPLVLDAFDLVSISEGGSRGGAAAANGPLLRRCIEAGIRVHAESAVADLLFGDRIPDGLLREAPDAEDLVPPLALRSGARLPSPILFGEIRSGPGSFLVLWSAVALLLPWVRTRRAGIVLVVLGGLGVAGATFVPTPLGEPLGIVHRILSEGRSVRLRLHASAEPGGPLEPGALPRPAPPSGRVEIDLLGTDRRMRVAGLVLSAAGAPPARLLERDPVSGSILDAFGPLGPGAWLRDGAVLGPTPPVAEGEPLQFPPEPGKETLDRRVATIVSLLAPRPGWVLVAALPAGRDDGGARWVVADVGED